jgi:peptidoglycan/LPS O-acetylase OafA/YrhL
LKLPSVPDANASTALPRSVGRVPSLDGLRGATVIIVLVSHLEVIVPIPSLAVVPGGTVSLDSFFVLSGFLITSLMLREQQRKDRVDSKGFYRRRALRLLPPLMAVLVFQAAMALSSGVSFHEEWTSLGSVMFYYSNYKLAFNSNGLGGNIAPGLQHLWSLALEEQFYFIWPWVTIFLLTIYTKLRTVVIVLGILIVAIAVHRAMMYHGVNSWYADFIRTDTRADGILIGCLLAHLWMRYKEPKKGVHIYAWVAAIFLLICLPFVDTKAPFLFYGGISAIDISCAVVILALLGGRWKGSRFFSLKPFVILGTVSYALYLWHLPIYFGIRYHGGGWPTPVRVSVAVFATFFFTALSWFFIEKPCLEWKDRLEGHPYVERLSLSTIFSWPRTKSDSSSSQGKNSHADSMPPLAASDDEAVSSVTSDTEPATGTGEPK